MTDDVDRAYDEWFHASVACPTSRETYRAGWRDRDALERVVHRGGRVSAGLLSMCGATTGCKSCCDDDVTCPACRVMIVESLP